jgi:1,4-alpha-glucan branching enzyme
MPYSILTSPSATTVNGANFLPGGTSTSFRVWAPNASGVDLHIAPSDAVTPQVLALAKDATGEYWSADIDGVSSQDQYRFWITNVGGGGENPGGIYTRVDPYARDVESSDYSAPAYVVQPATAAHFSSFNAPARNQYIIYQLHIGSFGGLNDSLAATVQNRTATFRQIADNKLDYIQQMNFNAVEFLPTSQEPFKQNEGYAPANFFAPDTDYGSPQDLVYLVDQCHKRGLAVIYDVVYNHAVADDAFNRLLQFDGNTVNQNRGIYFSTMNNFGPVPDFDRPEVQQFFEDNESQSFAELGADGLRFDSAQAILGTIHQTEVMSNMLAAAKAAFPNKFYVAEHNDPVWAVDTCSARRRFQTFRA